MMSPYINKPEDTIMPSTEAHKKASIKWKAKALRRVPLDVRKEYYEYVLGRVPELTGTPVNAFIKAAITEKIQRDGLDLPIDQYNP